MFITHWLLKQKSFRQNELHYVRFPEGNMATLLEVDPFIKPAQALKEIGIPFTYNGSILIHSGAAQMSSEYAFKLKRLFSEGLAQFAEENRILVVDGATDVGGNKLIGEARRAIQGKFLLLGVTISDAVTYPGGPEPETPRRFRGQTTGERWALNPHHSHFLLVRAGAFGAESPLLTGIAQSTDKPCLALIVNGGEIVAREAATHARRKVPLVTLKGSGRFADELAESTPASVLRRRYPTDAAVEIFDVVTQSPEAFKTLLKKVLKL